MAFFLIEFGGVMPVSLFVGSPAIWAVFVAVTGLNFIWKLLYGRRIK